MFQSKKCSYSFVCWYLCCYFEHDFFSLINVDIMFRLTLSNTVKLRDPVKYLWWSFFTIITVNNFWKKNAIIDVWQVHEYFSGVRMCTSFAAGKKCFYVYWADMLNPFDPNALFLSPENRNRNVFRG